MSERELALLRNEVARLRLARRVRDERVERELSCSGCGRDTEGRTLGCRTCGYRHQKRERRAVVSVRERELELRRARYWGDREPVRRRPGTCARCGCGLDERSRGCEACGNRHWARAQRAAA